MEYQASSSDSLAGFYARQQLAPSLFVKLAHVSRSWLVPSQKQPLSLSILRHVYQHSLERIFHFEYASGA